MNSLDCASPVALVESESDGGGRFVKILIVDDHQLFRDGMKHLLVELSETVELSEAEDCASAAMPTK